MEEKIKKKKPLIEQRDILSRIPQGPGVYLMKDRSGTIIYVGKARDIKKRMSSYFSSRLGHDVKTLALVKQIYDFETILTGTEKEALILESNLIKRHKPRYNVTLKDDKRYPALRLDIAEKYPTLKIARKIKNDGAVYFGPFSSSGAVRETLKLINKTFKLRKCGSSTFKNRSRPCLNHQMDACLAPCCLDVGCADYNEAVKDAVLFLKGKTPSLIKKIHDEMIRASQSREFEKAAILRDKKFALERTLEKQVSVTADRMDRDIIAIARENEFSMVAVLFARGGYLMGSQSFPIPQTLSSDAEIIGSFVRQYYEINRFIPEEIVVAFQPEEKELLESVLSDAKNQRPTGLDMEHPDHKNRGRGKKRVRILCPQRGEKANLVRMGAKNAEKDLKDHIASLMADRDLMSRLKRALKMDVLPKRIECFDNSNMSGKEAVSGMVVFLKGRAEKSEYRKYKIRNVSGHDDYAYMAEALKRRYGKGDDSMPYPDLLLVDGGKGQLNIAMAILRESGLKGAFEVAGIAKKDESKGEIQDKIYRPGRSNPIQFGREGDLLLFLQRVRDEAHRFAIAFHRKRRKKALLHSILDDAPGIGKKRKIAMLSFYKSIKKIKDADINELAGLPAMTLSAARSVKETLKDYK